MNTTNYIRIFRGDDSDALGYQTIVGTIKTDLDLTGCKAVFRFLGFYAEFNPIPEDKKLTIVIPAQASRGFPPGVGYASLKVFDSLDKIRTFTNRIPVIVDTMTPSCGCGEFEVSFSPFPELEPLKIFIGPNADDFDQYTGFVSKIIDRASLVKYGLAMLADAMSEDGGVSGKAASPLAVKAAYDAVIKELVDNYYTAEQTEEAIDRVAAYYITYTAAGAAFPTYASLANATTVYSGGKVRVPTRNDYCVVLADETHQGAEYRYIYAVAEGQTTGRWQPQFPVEGVMTVDQTVTKNSANPVAGGGVWSAIWGALSALPTGFTSLYDWCVAQLAGKLDTSSAAPAFTAKIYAVNDLCTYNGVIYRCKVGYTATASSTKPDADTTHWEAKPVSDLFLRAAHLVTEVIPESRQFADVPGVVVFNPNGVSYLSQLSEPQLMMLLQNGGVVDAFGNAMCFPTRSATSNKIYDFALAASNPTTGNLAALDAQGNPTDSTIPAADVATKMEVADATNTANTAINVAADALNYANAADDKASQAIIGAGDALNLANQVLNTIPYSLGTPTVIDEASSETVEGETVYYGAATLANRTANIVQVTAATALDELRITFPAATSGKVRDFGLRVEIGTGSSALAAPALVPIAPTGETIKIENADGTIPKLADGTATAKGVTLLYFSETALGVFVVKGEQVEEVA